MSGDTEAIARRLIEANMYMTISTADADGLPWVSPVWFAAASETEFLWRVTCLHQSNSASTARSQVRARCSSRTTSVCP
jgi:hypothetical protein